MREEYNSILTIVIRDSRFPIIFHFTFTFSTLRLGICIVVRDCTGDVACDCCRFLSTLYVLIVSFEIVLVTYKLSDK